MIILLLFSLFIRINSQPIAEIRSQNYDCEPNCWFLEEIVSYETISKWPRNCTEICGKMIFNQYSDIPVFELQSYFANVSVFRGSISFEKSKYASIEFLSGLKSIECEPYTFGFYNNPNLEQLNFGPSTNFTCPFSIFDNKRLDASAFCGINEGLFEVISDGNLKNCPGCIGTEMYKKTTEDFRNCTLVTTSLDLLSYQFIANGFDLTAFGDIENISAEFSVVRTDFESLSFLKNLKTIKGSAYDTVSYDIDIRDNQNLTRLGISLIRNLIPRKPVFLANFEANHADFCFTIDEFKVFLENKVVFGNLNAKLCENKTTACIFKNLKDLKSNCSEIQGNISINSGDEVYIGKLKSVRFIWGSLTVQDTNITDLAFLESLEYAVNLNSSTIPIRLISNKMLESAKLPNLKRVFSQTQFQISFENSVNGFLNSAACLDLMQNTTDTVVTVDGKQCEVIDRTNNQDGNNYGSDKFSMGTFVWIFLYNFASLNNYCLIQFPAQIFFAVNPNFGF